MQTDLIHTHYAARKGSPEQVLRQYLLGKAFLSKHFPSRAIRLQTFFSFLYVPYVQEVYDNRIILVWIMWCIKEKRECALRINRFSFFSSTSYSTSIFSPAIYPFVIVISYIPLLHINTLHLHSMQEIYINHLRVSLDLLIFSNNSYTYI